MCIRILRIFLWTVADLFVVICYVEMTLWRGPTDLEICEDSCTASWLHAVPCLLCNVCCCCLTELAKITACCCQMIRTVYFRAFRFCRACYLCNFLNLSAGELLVTDVIICNVIISLLFVFRSILWQSRPNKAGRKCPYVRAYVRTSVRPQSFFDFNEIWHVGRGRWVMYDGMQYDPIQGQGHKPSKLEIRPFPKAISSIIYNGSWQLTTDS